MSDQNPSSATAIDCGRCGLHKPSAQGVTWGGRLGQDIRAKVCNDCWQEWLQAEVIVINELRLNFMDPESQTILARHLREFLMLPEPS